jgi:Fe-S-cluster containining protein
MFGKYYGIGNLADIDAFWKDIAEVYHDVLVPLPLEINYRTLRMVSGFLDCPPGKCGECCRYAAIALTGFDEERILSSGFQKLDEFCVVTGGTKSISRGKDGECPFLTDNACSIYAARPDICYTFPIQGGVKRTIGSKEIEQMHVRMKCGPALTLVRTVISRALKANPKLVLLPDLTIVTHIGGGSNG